MFTNANSYMNKRDEVEFYALQNDIDIMAIVESWASSEIMDAELAIEGFILFRRDRSRIPWQRGGGLLLYVRIGLQMEELQDVNRADCEALWCRMMIEKGREVIVGLCYRSGSNSKEEDEAMFDAIGRMAGKQLILLGDFNYPEIDWDEGCTTGEGERFLEVIQDNFMYQHVREATRGENILDLVLTSDQEMVADVRIEGPVGRSDHNVVCFDLNVSEQRKCFVREEFDYAKADWKAINGRLIEMDWNEEFKECSVQEMWNKIVSILNGLKVEYIPMRKGSRKRMK